VLPNFEVTLHLHGGGGYGNSQNTSEYSVSQIWSEYAAALITTRLRYATTGQRSQVIFTDPSPAHNTEMVLSHKGIFTFHL